MTIEQVLRQQYPDVAKRMDTEGCWNYVIHAPLSLEDKAIVEVVIDYGTEARTHTQAVLLKVTG